MTIVSLDQNFLRNFATEKDHRFVRLHESLRRSVSEKRAICPMHLEETKSECSLLEAGLRNRIYGVAEVLSRGMAFHDFGVVLGYKSLRLVRPELCWPALRPAGPSPALTDNEGAFNRNLKRDYQQRLADLPYPPPTYELGDGIFAIEEALVCERAAFMFRLVESIAQKRSLETGRERWEYTDRAGQVLLNLAITHEECCNLREAILQRKWDAVDILHVHSRLSALLENDELRCGRKTDPNDALDLSRLAVGLPQADVICCDRAMGSLIKRSTLLDPEHGSAVFTAQTIESAIAHIDALPLDK